MAHTEYNDIVQYDPIYQLDSTGKLRSWRAERRGAAWRTVSGLYDGEKVTSSWKVCTGKNLGKANATTDVEQCEFVIQSEYTKKLARKYKKDQTDAMFEKTYIKPMLAHKFDPNLVEDVNFYMQPKLDGVRCIVTRDGIFTREGRPIVSCNHIFEQMKMFFGEDFAFVEAFDGEIYNHKLRDNFNEIVSMVKKITGTAYDLDHIARNIEFWIYDFIPAKGFSHMTFSDRHVELRVMQTTTVNMRPSIVFTPTSQMFCGMDDAALELYSQYVQFGYEGAMVRIANSTYEHKRSKALLKWKSFTDEEFEIVEFHEGIGNWAGAVKSVTCVMHDGKKFRASVKGSYEEGRDLLERLQSGLDVPMYATVCYQMLTPDGVPRFGVVKAFYNEKRDA